MWHTSLSLRKDYDFLAVALQENGPDHAQPSTVWRPQKPIVATCTTLTVDLL